MKFYGQKAIYQCEESPFNSGAEGRIYATTDGQHCIKVYKNPAFLPEAKKRIAHMLSCPPPVMTYSDGAPLFAWPVDCVYTDATRTKFCGFCMKKLGKDYRSIIVALRPNERRQFFGGDSFKLTAALAYNLVEGCRSLNAAGYHLADLGTGNLLVNKRGQVVWVDTDNLCFIEGGLSYTPEYSTFAYLPPELQRFSKLSSPPFHEYADRFMIAVMIWQLLLLNTHPFQQGHFNGKVQGSVIPCNIEYGSSLWENPPANKGCPDVKNLLPDSTLKLFRRVFSYSHQELISDPQSVIMRRPSLLEWKQELKMLMGSVQSGERKTGSSSSNKQGGGKPGNNFPKGEALRFVLSMVLIWTALMILLSFAGTL